MFGTSNIANLTLMALVPDSVVNRASPCTLMFQLDEYTSDLGWLSLQVYGFLLKRRLCAGSERTAVLATAALDKKVRLWRGPQA